MGGALRRPARILARLFASLHGNGYEDPMPGLPPSRVLLAHTATWAVALTFFSVSAMQVALGLAFLAWLAAPRPRVLATARPWHAAALVWIAAGLLSLVLAQDRGRALSEAAGLLLALAPLPLALALAQRNVLERLERVWTAAAALAALVGLAQVAAGGTEVRASGTVGHYMTYSGLLAMAGQWLLARLLFGPREGRAARALVLLLVAAALLGTHTRSAWVGTALASAVQLVLWAPRRVLLLPLVLGLAYLLAPAPVQERAASLLDSGDRTANERLFMWRSGLAMALDHPLGGVGLDNVETQMPAYRLPDDPWLPWRRLAHLHSNPVHVLAERGFPGLLAYLLLALVPFLAALRLVRRRAELPPALGALAVGSLGAQVAFHAAGLFEYSFGDDEVLTFYWVAVAVPLALPLAAAEPAPARRPVPWRLLAASALGLLVLGEVWARASTREGRLGGSAIGSRDLRPRPLPVAALRAALEGGVERGGLVHDPRLGWTREPLERLVLPRGQDPLRIVVLGDEAAEGLVEELCAGLAAAGRAARVVDLSVPGYGHDQMLLRWRSEGRVHAPRAVVVVTRLDANERDVNLFPLLRDPGAPFPFLKPRFRVRGGELVSVLPLVPTPTEVPEALASLPGSRLAPYEAFFDPRSLEDSPLTASRLANYLWSRIAPLEEPEPARFYATDHADLSLRLLVALAREVRGSGADAHTVVVHEGAPDRAEGVFLDRVRGRAELGPLVGGGDVVDELVGRLVE